MSSSLNSRGSLGAEAPKIEGGTQSQNKVRNETTKENTAKEKEDNCCKVEESTGKVKLKVNKNIQKCEPGDDPLTLSILKTKEKSLSSPAFRRIRALDNEPQADHDGKGSSPRNSQEISQSDAHCKVLFETEFGPEMFSDVKPDESSVLATSSSGVGTSLVSLSNASTGKRSAQEPHDFWNQVVQQVSYIDSTGGSARSSLLLSCAHQIPPGGVSNTEHNVATLPCSEISSYSTQDSSAPSSPHPLSLRLQQHLSFRDQARCGRGKLSRFYSQQESEPAITGGSELRVLQPLLHVNDGNQLTCTSSATGTNDRANLATVWGGGSDTRIIRHPLRRGITLNHANSVAMFSGGGPRRKTSSWEESVSLQRRRSIASREEARGWRDRVLTEETEDAVSAATPTSKEDTPQDLRYYFQHPYLRLFTTYFIIFCNFLLFAEDPISHSHAESVIPMVGNVFSFVLTKYPPEWRWALIKVLMWLLAIVCGLVVGKLFVHNVICGKILRLKMFRDEQGSWIAMFLTVIISIYLFSHVYNLLLWLFYNKPYYYIDSRMGITYASVMKTAACGTWLGDLITALMVTDVMLQDNLYPEWAPAFRNIWRRSNVPRILIFWVGSVLATAVVVTFIVSDFISWDRLNRDFIASTELTRAFFASFILVMDIVIMMQDWDFPHFTTTLHVNLPGFSVATLEWKYAEVHLTGKWFNYGLIFMVMILDLNMWKNQIFYNPARFGQYTGPDDKIRTVNDQELLQTGNRSLWTWENRCKINETTKLPYSANDIVMNSRYLGYPMELKIIAFIPSGIGMILFISIIVLHGRFPNSQSNPSNSKEVTLYTDVTSERIEGLQEGVSV
ncbi:uncharacterized protein LOC142319439 isoform X2 [Lycorma delicatula]|uniref:uncharacterized protein LOC142319439 isoform X2 n=1 Tax=Lycorma delicatula TaxID=130591 RepID=UPI003F514549